MINEYLITKNARNIGIHGLKRTLCLWLSGMKETNKLSWNSTGSSSPGRLPPKSWAKQNKRKFCRNLTNQNTNDTKLRGLQFTNSFWLQNGKLLLAVWHPAPSCLRSRPLIVTHFCWKQNEQEESHNCWIHSSYNMIIYPPTPLPCLRGRP